MAEKMVQHGVPDDMITQSDLDTATGAQNMMSRIRGFFPGSRNIDNTTTTC